MLGTAALLLALTAAPSIQRGAAGLGLAFDFGAGIDETATTQQPVEAAIRLRFGVSKDLGRWFGLSAIVRLSRAAPRTSEGSAALSFTGRIALSERFFVTAGLGARAGFLSLHAPEPSLGGGPEVSLGAEYWFAPAISLRFSAAYAAIVFGVPQLQHRAEQVISVGFAL